MMQLPPLTLSQQKILLLIYRFRFLSRHHIQTFLSHKSPSPTKALLADLTTKQYLTRIYTPTFPQNTKPAIYFTGKNAIPYFKTHLVLTQKQLMKRYQEKNRSETFQTHCLLLADLYCNLLLYAKKQNKDITFFTRTDIEQKETSEVARFLQSLRPDGYYRYTGTGIAKQAFLEIIDEHLPAFAIRRKIRRYARVTQDTAWEILGTKRFPSLLILVPTEKKLNSVKHAVRKVCREWDNEILAGQLRCNIALSTDIQTKSIDDPIWTTI